MITDIPFKRIKTSDYNLTRTQKGVLVDGYYEKVKTSQTIDALIYPYVNKDLIEILPEALRRRKNKDILQSITYRP